MTKRGLQPGLDELFEWYGREPRPGFTKATVAAWRVNLEARGLGAVSINVRITVVRKLAVEAADNGFAGAGTSQRHHPSERRGLQGPAVRQPVGGNPLVVEAARPGLKRDVFQLYVGGDVEKMPDLLGRHPEAGEIGRSLAGTLREALRSTLPSECVGRASGERGPIARRLSRRA
jgi:hypothetical protein